MYVAHYAATKITISRKLLLLEDKTFGGQSKNWGRSYDGIVATITKHSHHTRDLN